MIANAFRIAQLHILLTPQTIHVLSDLLTAPLAHLHHPLTALLVSQTSFCRRKWERQVALPPDQWIPSSSPHIVLFALINV